MTARPETDSSVLPEGLLYVDGVLRRGEHGRSYDNIGPWTSKPVGIGANASQRDVEEVIAAARRAFEGLTQTPCKFDISALCPAHSTGVQQGVNVDGLESIGL
ncbi:hypothetical protein ACFOON_00685 [Novosphingobium piscinae]|uniref:Aldehyde dehydrogenase family protein n=1 Tax=Novosphingobium piscinae TaxID=1507448 RepID=A0A7X1KNP1_9SPHN|nr:hypothetical protein [Novosphingobium piscinae]MBC2667901.1 hypothetical protein [Novosphingobium piscinae]